MASVQVMADAEATPETQIDYWLAIYQNRELDAGVRSTAAGKLDELLRAPVWPT